MKTFVEVRTVAACMAALVMVAGCGDGGNGQQAVSSDGAPAGPAAQKVSMKVASAFPMSLPLLGKSATMLTEKIDRV